MVAREYEIYLECESMIYMESMYLCIIIRGFDWLAKMIFSHVKNIKFFTCV